MAMWCLVAGKLRFATQSDLECKRKSAEPENICQNIQIQKRQEYFFFNGKKISSPPHHNFSLKKKP